MGKMKRGSLPHHRVYTRLGPSKIHGVGVFAIRNIKKGTILDHGDDAEMVWIEKGKIDKLPKAMKKLYQDFCVFKGNLVGCPKNFNVLTVSWYFNHSKNPNVYCDENYNFVALRDIEKYEELTVDYATYSDE